MFREMDFLSRMARGLHQDSSAIDFHQVLKAATIYGARALRIDQDLGSLSIGKEASFLVIDLDSPNLTYVNDVVSAMVHRASITDIRNIYIKGEKYL
jgi:5-methylthioadenosine/S-adenosylhomocysteine deaminase